MLYASIKRRAAEFEDALDSALCVLGIATPGISAAAAHERLLGEGWGAAGLSVEQVNDRMKARQSIALHTGGSWTRMCHDYATL